jgi:predicted PurR-regulated permease PerM
VSESNHPRGQSDPSQQPVSASAETSSPARVSSVPPEMRETSPELRRGRRLGLATLLLLTFFGAVRVAEPLWVAIAFGTVMAFAMQPVHRRLALRFGGHVGLAAALTTVFTALASVATGTLVVYVLTRDLSTLVVVARRTVVHQSVPGLMGGRVGRLLDAFGIDPVRAAVEVQHRLGALSEYAATLLGAVVQSTASVAMSVLLGVVIAAMTMYYVLLEWPSLVARLERVLPLDPAHTRALLAEIRNVGRSALVGSVATAIVQGVLGGMGYTLARVPHAASFGLLTALGSFVPAVGTALVWLPIGMYLLFTGHTAAAAFELVWGMLVVIGIADYVIRPRLVGGTGEEHPLLMLIALLGGLEVFGLAGLLAGPVLMSLFVATLRLYERKADR